MHRPRQAWTRRAVLAAAMTFAVACIADPMPSPGQAALDTSRVLVSAAAPGETGPLRLVGVIGLPGAAPGAGLVEIRHVRSNSLLVKPVSEEGSFAGVVTATPGDRIVVTFRLGSDVEVGAGVELVVTDYNLAESPATPDTQSDGRTAPTLSVSPPDEEGRVVISGSALAADEIAVVGNARTGVVGEAAVSSGAFSLQLPADAGDTLVVIVHNPRTERVSEVASLTVPAS